MSESLSRAEIPEVCLGWAMGRTERQELSHRKAETSMPPTVKSRASDSQLLSGKTRKNYKSYERTDQVIENKRRHF